MELKSKYINEQYLFEAQMAEIQYQRNLYMNEGGKGPRLNENTPTPPSTSAFSNAFSNAFG